MSIDFFSVALGSMSLVLKQFWYMPVALVVLTLLQSAAVKGWLGEVMVNLSISLFLDKGDYRLLKNVTLPTVDGGTTQIDHIVVSPFGIFVIETKHMRGWIFGAENQQQWTQKLFRKSFKFQNPLRQNYKHTRTIEAYLDVAPQFIHSIVVFVGDCTFKTAMPANVTRPLGLLKFIQAKKERVLATWDVDAAVARISGSRMKPSMETHRRHVEHVRSIKHRRNLQQDRGENQ